MIKIATIEDEENIRQLPERYFRKNDTDAASGESGNDTLDFLPVS